MLVLSRVGFVSWRSTDEVEVVRSKRRDNQIKRRGPLISTTKSWKEMKRKQRRNRDSRPGSRFEKVPNAMNARSDNNTHLRTHNGRYASVAPREDEASLCGPLLAASIGLGTRRTRVYFDWWFVRTFRTNV